MCICFMIPLGMNLLGKSLCWAFALLYLQSSAVSRAETRVTYRRQQRKAGGVSCAFPCFGSQRELGCCFGSSEGRDIPAGSLLALLFLLHPFPGSSDPPSKHSSPTFYTPPLAWSTPYLPGDTVPKITLPEALIFRKGMLSISQKKQTLWSVPLEDNHRPPDQLREVIK